MRVTLMHRDIMSHMASVMLFILDSPCEDTNNRVSNDVQQWLTVGITPFSKACSHRDCARNLTRTTETILIGQKS